MKPSNVVRFREPDRLKFVAMAERFFSYGNRGVRLMVREIENNKLLHSLVQDAFDILAHRQEYRAAANERQRAMRDRAKRDEGQGRERARGAMKAMGNFAKRALLDFAITTKRGTVALRLATRDEILRAAHRYEATGRTDTQRARWLYAIGELVPAGKAIAGDHVTEEQAASLLNKAEAA